MRAVVTITLKDLRLGLRDRSAFVIGILAPLTLAIILNAVAGDFFDGDQAFSVDYGVVDHDGGEMADTLITVLEDDLDGLDVDLVTGLDEDDARRQVDDGDPAAVFVVPDGC